MNFNKLKGKMREKNISQGEMAGFLNVSVQTFNAKINNRTQFTLEEVIKMTSILKLDNPIDIFFTNSIPNMQRN